MPESCVRLLMMLRILFAGGGSVGHIAPMVAVWRAIQNLSPCATAFFACSNAPDDARFLQKEGLEFAVAGSRCVTLLNILPAFFHSWRLLGKCRPHAIFTKGGGVTIPIALAGWMKGIPIVVHESDAVPGRATTLITRFATASIDGFMEGNPLRPGIADGLREEGLRIAGLTGERPVLLVTGGSQGAQVFNDAIIDHADALLRSVDIIHITGEGKRGVEGVKTGYWKSPFVHDDLAHLYAAADIALSRAGSGNIGELAANGIPSILVPLEGLAQNHQVRNAAAAALSGGCIVLRQAFLDDELVAMVRHLADHPEIRAVMKPKMRSLHKPDADVAVAHILLAAAAERCEVS